MRSQRGRFGKQGGKTFSFETEVDQIHIMESPPFFVGPPGGSISDLSVCVNRFHPEEIVGRVRGSQVFFFFLFLPRF